MNTFFFLSEDYFLSIPDFHDKVPSELLSHEDQYRNGLSKACLLFRKIKDLQEKGGSMESYRYIKKTIMS
jgi:hypothetical protein